MVLPEKIAGYLSGKTLTREQTGLSGAGVWMSEDLVLKIETPDGESENNLAMLRWLEGKVPVPRVVAGEIRDGKRYLLMTRLPGEMACGESWLARPEALVNLLADGLRRLWAVDIAHCPCDQRVAAKLENARRIVEEKRYDLQSSYSNALYSYPFLQ